MKFLITDLNIKLDGHKLGFIKNLIHYLENHPDQNLYFFLTNDSEEFKLSTTVKNIIIIPGPSPQIFKITNGLFKYGRKCFKEFEYIHKTALDYQIERLILLDFDPYQLAIGFNKTPYQISGIWFRPHAVGAFNNTEYGRKNNLTKYCIAAIARLNKNLRKVFILNDHLKPKEFNKGRELYFYLPDPVFDYPQDHQYNLRKEFNIPSKNLILLQFGNIDNRKNTENIIRALENLPKNLAQKVTLLIVGKHAPGYAEQLYAMKSPDSSYQMISIDEFVADTIMEAIFAQSDVIIRMNVGFFGSSGVVGIAARHNKVCLVSDTGVMAREVSDYKLGRLIAVNDILTIQKTIEEFIQNPKSTFVDGTAYTKSHNLEAYARTLLS